MAKLPKEVVNALGDLQKQLENFPPGNSVTPFLHARGKKDAAEKWRRVRMEKDLEADYRWALINHLKNSAAVDDLRPYSFDGMMETSVGVLPREEVLEDGVWPFEPPNLDWPHIFNLGDDFKKKIDLLVSVLPLKQNKKLIIYRKLTFNALANPPNKLESVLDPHEHIFRKPKGAIFQFDYRADFFEWDGQIYVLSQLAFESLSNVVAATETKAKAALDTLKKLPDLTIENFDKFADTAMGRKRSCRRLATAEHNGILKSLTASHIEQCIADVKLPIKFSKKGKSLILEPDASSGVAVDEVVKVLVDYFTRGLSSRTIYATDVKHPV